VNRRHLKHFTLLALLLWLSTGCYLPIRQDALEAREHVPDEAHRFESGMTTREDVLIVMGEPDAISADEAGLTYRWRSIGGVIIITQCTPPVELDTETTLVYRFDEEGVLLDTAVSVD